MTYRPTIGLEIHAELSTRTKMFCASANDPEERDPNTNVCPVCLAHPGTLPTINEEAVRHVLRVGAALGGTLADYTEFDRKSYFYPDIPKGYQISQYEHPLVSGGSLVGIPVTRVHLEEDTARSTHGTGDESVSLIDFNRAGVPLMELVTEPEIHDAKTAAEFAKELQLLLRTLGASHANLEKGEMRIEANISVSKTDEMGTKVEVKNLNSFRSVERAIAFEVERQTALLERGEKVIQETRGWDESSQTSFHQRVKEGSADYRYFPEPDLPKLRISEIPDFSVAAIQASLPELPWEKRARYEAMGLTAADAVYLTGTIERGVFFDRVAVLLEGKQESLKLAANYIISDLGGWYAKNGGVEFANIAPESFSKMIHMIERGDLSSRGAKDTLVVLAERGGEAEEIAKELGLLQVNDREALAAVVATVVQSNPGPVEEYKAGKESALQFLVGQSMKASKGAGNPSVIRELLLEALSS
ncbi:MAG TPA: Asp-tRNA(Asn)/Glu-tRNA(Gln) amidotransferase subunit GatB [Candidatus Paceibacterota bacterium]|nr:Asp-tRNA(Asn)/Glu-tRNA(Gln) amidotransferase subunit GatB [Candidatus Paceibacterota bacterium]